ncbi:LysM peptidoglycan-binding domain-containing protein [Agromyces aerolatus]|uniref:LysM peptidoglycan-binding domain-containing protein n=1 Tax=Agromyces sp. LY-1074 TaxID=3074080 RepID=UPI002859F879|nr:MULTISPECIES: LysM peptidoglycan-binding domain-containing protein [unclassified Agromyces]MDR5700781.1 LysM peptidoglycan-binding domain-containing protein [Agromyces sp. LY-1074]MDR5707302.1 LysM peptidoglycan-binding domain-containing protein [Agromyces sp. LY-1358]
MGDRTGRTGPNDERGRTPRAARQGRLRRVLSLPIAIAGTIAVTLGFVQPAHAAAAPASKRQPTPKGSVPGKPRTGAVSVASVGEAIPGEYVVVEGDTVSGIAERFGLATPDVLALNGLSWSSLIFPGQRLVLRAASAAPQPAPAPPAQAEIARHVVVEGDTMSGIAAQHGLSLDALLSINGLSRTSLIFPGQSIVLAPASAPSAPAAAPAAPAPAPPPAPVETVTPVSAPLTDEMRQHARVIVDVGRSLGVPDQGLVVALAAAAQESGLRNVDHGDRDSLGLFQQRPSQGWGTPDEVRDPTRAALAFYGGPTNPNPGRTRGLLDIHGWESMSVTQAAQSVQLSAHPDLYAKWEQQARAWLAELG